MPRGAKASMTALATATVLAIVPISPAPFTPSGLCGDGVSTKLYKEAFVFGFGPIGAQAVTDA